MSQHLFVVDPGLTNGIAEISVPESTPAAILDAWETTDLRAISTRLRYVWSHDPDVVVIVEDWVNWSAGADARPALTRIGAMMMLTKELGVPMILREPMARTVWPDTKDRTPEGYWLESLKKHDDRRQAVRHGMAYVCDVMLHKPTLGLLRKAAGR